MQLCVHKYTWLEGLALGAQKRQCAFTKRGPPIVVEAYCTSQDKTCEGKIVFASRTLGHSSALLLKGSQ